MQNSVSEGAPYETSSPIVASAPYNNEAASTSLDNNSSPNFTSETPAYSYDEVFPALPQNITPTPTVTNQIGSRSNKMRIGSSTVSQVFQIPFEERKLDSSDKFGESESVRACHNITTITGADIEISSSKDQSLTFLVTGKPQAVAEAKKRILNYFQTQAVVTIKIPKEHHRYLLGKGGQKLKDLEKATGCKITVPIISDPSDAITITGPKEGIEKAAHEIQVTSDEQSKQSYERISVPKMYHPFICGGFNETLNQLIQETNVRINVPPPSVQSDEITIAGEKEGVQTAKDRIMKIYKDMEKKCNSVSVEVPRAQHRYVVGYKRNTIAEILQKTGVYVEMPPQDAVTDTIKLIGPQPKLGLALSMVYEKANSVVTSSIEAPGWIQKYVRKSANINKKDQPKLHITFNEKENKIDLEGPPEEVEKIQKDLENSVAEYERTYVYDELEVDSKFYKHIIGKGGANVNQLKEETGVTINFGDEDGSSGNIIRIEGSREGVDIVKKKLKEVVAKLENEKEKIIKIDQRFYPSIIGSKGEKIREIRDMFSQVLIKFPNLDEKNDDVIIRGPKDDVEKCCKCLNKIVKCLKENFTLEVPIHKQLHKFVIGKEGANIKKIRAETQTKIDLPGEDESSDVIRITGKKENVYQAKEKIEKIQNELASTLPPKILNNLIGADGKLITEEYSSANGKGEKGSKGSKDKKEEIHTAEVKAKPEHHKFLIGKNGANIRRIRETSGARITFPSENDTDKETITIVGTKDQVEKAKMEFVRTIRDLENIVEAEMIVDPIYHKPFVSRRAALIHQITEECGGNITISFPRPGEDSNKVTLKGSKECIEMAKQKIESTVEDLKSMVTIMCVIPQKHHRIVMGVKGTKVQLITSEHDVQINFPERDSHAAAQSEQYAQDGSNGMVNGEEPVRPCDIIKITGKPENCKAAKEALLKLVPVTIEIPVPVDFHGYIIGKSGGAVRQLMEDFEVHISVSPADQKLDCIKITGAPANVQKAKEALDERVKQLEKEKEDRILKSFSLSIDVDPEYHPKIIGKAGAVITKIRNDFNVQITLPKRGDPDENIIKIQGYEEKAKAARDHILGIVNELKDRIKEEIEIDHRVHSRLIGQRGRSIRKFMDDYGVEIKFPRQGSAQNLVTIIGTEEKVMEAKKEILALAEEYEFLRFPRIGELCVCYR
ncbi:UNVERIFIED_CONTAM: hypothetical protein PYX00_010437 [Menopon gallinae]|uniref:K Homology domain-containing protein n=1 Tax=Menopon gallinae TaxID=328185 RepID=A0AAW2HG93_9NEOP